MKRDKRRDMKFKAALLCAGLCIGAPTTHATVIDFTANATHAMGLAWPNYPSTVGGKADFASTPGSGAVYGGGQYYTGAGTMTLTFNPEFGGTVPGPSSMALFVDQGHTDSSGIYDLLSMGISWGTYAHFYLSLYFTTGTLVSESYADAIAVLASADALNNDLLKPLGVFRADSWYNVGAHYGQLGSLTTSGPDQVVGGTAPTGGSTAPQPATSVPEPATLGLMMAGVALLLAGSRRRATAKACC